MDEADDRELRQKRALYRARHRGTKEMDWLLGRYADAKLADLPTAGLLAFETLLAIQDSDLEQWIKYGNAGGDPRYTPELAALVVHIRQFHRLEE